MTKDIAGAVRDFFGVSSAKPYRGKDITLGTYSSVGSGFSGRLKPGDPDDFLKLLEQRVNKMPARPRRAPRGASSRSSKRKAPRGKKRSIKRKAPIRKSTKRKKRKVSKPKSVPLTVGTCRKRIFDHEASTHNHANYSSFSSIGKKADLMDMVAQSILVHYMHRCGDYRANKFVAPSGDQKGDAGTAGLNVTSTWSKMKFDFLGQGATTTDNNDDTFDLAGGTATLDAMTTLLSAELLTQVKYGRRLSQVTVFRGDGATPQCILSDVGAGRNHIDVSCSAKLKMQNTTEADAPALASGDFNAGQVCDRTSALNIHRNPLDGLAYTFRNAVPKFKMQYLIGKSVDERAALQLVSVDSSTAAGGIDKVDFAAQGTEWKAPPPTPSTMFTNISGKKSAMSVAPGGHANFSLYEHYKGSVNGFFDRYFAFRWTNSAPEATLPPGGSCMLIGLKPKYRTGATEDIKLQLEYTFTYAARFSRAKLMLMPMETDLI